MEDDDAVLTGLLAPPQGYAGRALSPVQATQLGTLLLARAREASGR